MSCAGSLFFENIPPQDEGQPAKEGTAAGRFLQYLLENEANIPAGHENGVMFDEDMKYYGSELAANIKSRAQSEVLCEQRIDWVTRSGIVIRGQYDASYIHQGKLVIDDLKYGWKIVEVKDNWQLLGYAIGEVLRRQQYFERIVLRIMQPRPHHEDGRIREFEISYEQLLAYKEQIEQRMDQIAAGYKVLTTGDSCKYCPAAPEACPAFNKALWHGIDYMLSDWKQDNISEHELAYQLSVMNRVNEILKIKSDSLDQLAMSRIKEGKVIPGYMTEESYGDRKWKNGINPKVIETLTGINIVEQTMMSPAKAEKLGVNKDLVAQFVDRYFVKNKIVKKNANALGEKIFGKLTKS